MVILPLQCRGLNRFRGQRKIWAGNKLLSSIFAYVCMFFPPWYWFFWPCIITVLRYLLFALPFNFVLAFHFFPFLRPFIPLNYIPVPFPISLTRLFPLFNVQIAHPLDIYTGPGFLKSLYSLSTFLCLLLFSTYYFILPHLRKRSIVCPLSSITEKDRAQFVSGSYQKPNSKWSLE